MNGVKYSGVNIKELGSIIERFAIRKHNKFLLSLWNDLVDNTPVATGTARSNWLITPVRPSTKMNKRDGTRYPRPSEPDIAKYTYRWKKWYVVNNSPYMMRLNNGSSLQAPSGWIDAAIQRNLVKFRDELTGTD